MYAYINIIQIFIYTNELKWDLMYNKVINTRYQQYMQNCGKVSTLQISFFTSVINIGILITTRFLGMSYLNLYVTE